jgi:PEP-CTERM/exosortase A-associated glycosyltransferase
MRVLHVLHHSLPFLSGYSIRSSYIVNLQHSSGVRTAVVTSGQHPNGDSEREQIDGTEYRRTPKRVERTPLLRELRLMADLERAVDSAASELAPDVIHAHSPVLVGLPALRVARRRGIPMMYEVRDLWENAGVDRAKFAAGSVSYRLARSAESYVLRRADTVVTICNGLRKELSARVSNPSRLKVIANGVDVDAFCPAAADESLRHRWGLAGKQVVLYAGTFQPYEGLDLLVRAMRDVVARYPAAHLVIVGGSPGLAGGARSVTPEEHSLQSVVREQSLSAHVTFTGRIPHAEVKQMYALADVLAYPRRLTRTTALTTPLKPLEAMAMAKPVIVSDVPAMQELVCDGKTGLVFRAGDADDLASKCCDLLGNQVRRWGLGTAAREAVIAERQWATLVSQYLPLYEALAVGNRLPLAVTDDDSGIYGLR